MRVMKCRWPAYEVNEVVVLDMAAWWSHGPMTLGDGGCAQPCFSGVPQLERAARNGNM